MWTLPTYSRRPAWPHGTPAWDSEIRALPPTCCVMLGNSLALSEVTSPSAEASRSPNLLWSEIVFHSPGFTAGLPSEPIPPGRQVWALMVGDTAQDAEVRHPVPAPAWKPGVLILGWPELKSALSPWPSRQMNLHSFENHHISVFLEKKNVLNK